MLRRSLGSLPLQRRGAPGIATGRLAFEIAPDEVVQEHDLDRAHDQRRDRDPFVQRMRRLGNEVGAGDGIVTARHAQDAQIVHRIVNRIRSEEREPEVKLAQRVVQHAPGNLGVPVVDRPEHDQDWRHRHHHMEVRYYEHGVGKRQIHRHVAQEQARQPAVDKCKDEADGKQHGHGEMDVPPPQRQHPVVDLERRGNGDDQRRGGKEEPEVRIHSANVHVVRPYDETEAADRQNRPDHHAIAEDVLSCMGGNQVGDHAEGRQGDDVDLGMSEKPEQMLKQHGTSPVVSEVLSLRDEGGHEETRPQRLVQRHHDGADEQRGKCQQRQNGRHEYAPYRQGQTHHRHPARARLQHGHHVVQTAHGESDDEKSQGNAHQDDSPVVSRSAVKDGLRWVQRPSGARRPARDEETRHEQQHGEQVDPVAHHIHIGENHVAGTDHQRDQVVAEPSQE